ncbi:hypothetical protein [Larkinella rosea]|uniref:Uncharacterized protein n=1 Tax=Larkinella rosea TaxID=2025312 RepID=A0A3P1C218_9BACT|nr:hypothetical protein [Larkinella rosea]RRB07289.1 hypothetical protein EHT25_05800 [Larkinella rosea]
MNTSIESYTDMLQSLIALRKYVKLFYYTELNELLSVTSILTKLATGPDGNVVELASGEVIPVARLVNVDGVYAPGHEDYEDCLVCRI